MNTDDMSPTVQVLELGEVLLPDWHPRSTDISCVIQGFVVRHPDGVLLVDTGVGRGNSFIDEVYSPTTVPIVEALNDVGVDERDVAAIVNSHLHFDHCGQNQELPSAPVYVQAAELAAAERPHFTIPEWANIEPERRRVIDGDEEIAPGIRILATPGHTPGHQSVLIGDRTDARRLIVGQCSFCCADFESGTVDPNELHDETFLDASTESIERLRSLDVSEAYFSHDRTVYRPPGFATISS